MRKMLLSVCAALAVLGCGGDDGDLPPCLECTLCGSQEYTPWSFSFCFEGKIYPNCGRRDYNPSTHFCSGSEVYSKCGGRDYNPSTEFCSENSVYSVGFKGNSISNYRTVVIGTQTWMAENLDYNVEGSKCYDNKAVNCNTYGRLYDWATAMALPSSCNSNSCASMIQTPHRGICPSGWHIPKDGDWEALITFVGGFSTAGTKLKAESGWNDYQGTSGNGTDKYGFSALPGGGGYSDGSFYNLGGLGNWWSATDDASHRRMHNGDDVQRINYVKSDLYSVRCVQDYEKHSGKGNNISNYRTVVIGTQTWMAENLDYVIEGRKCYENDPANCNAYGSLYDWSTAMALPSSCNSTSCWNQIQSPHRGICPSGWHIPSYYDWDKLYRFADGSGTENPYSSPTAGKYLKATSGWNSYNSASGNGTDEYGFSALPGGSGSSRGDFSLVGDYGYWWSATGSDASDADGWSMGSYNECGGINGSKSYLYSVRCVQDYEKHTVVR